jgi:hypothetical protein
MGISECSNIIKKEKAEKRVSVSAYMNERKPNGEEEGIYVRVGVKKGMNIRNWCIYVCKMVKCEEENINDTKGTEQSEYMHRKTGG